MIPVVGVGGNYKRAGNEQCIKVSSKRCQLESYLQSVETEEIKTSYWEEHVTSVNQFFALDVADFDLEQLKLLCSILDI